MNATPKPNLPTAKRYALFADLGHNYLLLVRGNDILTAHRWGGFVRWIGGNR